MQQEMVDSVGVWVAIFTILGVMSTVTNVLVCYATVRNRALRTSNNAMKYYIFSLAITDILIGTLCVSLFISLQILQLQPCHYKSLQKESAFNNTTNVGDNSLEVTIIYRILNVMEVCLSACSIFHLCVMAFDRALSVSKPLFHRVKMITRGTALKLLSLPWILSMILLVLTSLSYAIPDHFGNVVPLLIGFILLPVTFIIICYAVIIFSIHKRNKQVSHEQTGCDAGGMNNSFSRINEMRLIKILACLILTFLVCWIPLIVLNIIYPDYTTLRNTGYDDFKVAIGTAAKCFHYANSVCNPCIYAIFNPAYRSEFRSLIKKFSCF